MTTNNPFLQPGRLRAAMNTLGLRPNKELGQNFLIDGEALASVVDAAGLGSTDTVIEVGPGFGVLTYELAQRAGRVVAIEFDQRLADRLPDALAQPNVEVITQDVLRVDPAMVVGEDGVYKVVANLPYHITSPILRHFLEARPAPSLMVVMVQLEVAQRIVARPPDMSILAHAVQLYAEAEIVARVPAGSFLPPPKVDSAVLRLRLRTRPLVDVEDVDRLFRVIRAGFSQARKKLGNSLGGGLASMGIRVSKEDVLGLLQGVGVNPDRRAETLTLAEWAAVDRALAHKGWAAVSSRKEAPPEAP